MPPPKFQTGVQSALALRALTKCTLWLILLAAVGCTQPLRVNTRAAVDAVGNINVDAIANANVKAQLAPTPRLEPVVAMGLPHRPQNPNAAKIAIIDVDGLILNNDAT